MYFERRIAQTKSVERTKRSQGVNVCTERFTWQEKINFFHFLFPGYLLTNRTRKKNMRLGNNFFRFFSQTNDAYLKDLMLNNNHNHNNQRRRRKDNRTLKVFHRDDSYQECSYWSKRLANQMKRI